MSRSLTISIAMCTYNGERFLQEQLDSFLRQTRLPDELVVCDDDSQDGTIVLLESFAAQAPFPVRIFRNPQNLGYKKNFEKAISLCQGDIIVISDQDDIWMPEKLTKFERVFLDQPQIGYVFSDAAVIDENLKPLGYSLWEFLRFTAALQNKFKNGGALDIFLKTYLPWGCTLALRSDLREFIFPVPGEWSYDFWIGFIAPFLAEVGLLCEPLIYYRQHSSQCYGVQPLNTIEKVKHSKSVKRTHYSWMAEEWTLALTRLTSDTRINVCKNHIVSIEEKIKHLKARAKMPHSILGRFPFVLMEVINGRYHRFSNGLLSAAKDLFM